MPHKHQRHSLKKKEGKLVLMQVSERLGISLESLFGSKANIETIEADFGQLILVNSEPVLFRVKKNVFPTLFFEQVAAHASRVVVDMGAIPYVCNGADVMAPGIVRVEGEFSKNDIVLVVDEKHGKPLAIGEILYDTETVRNVKHGAVVRTVHFVSDKIWNFAKALQSSS